MLRSTRRASLMAGCLLAIGAVAPAAAGASWQKPSFTEVPVAKTRSAGYAPASALSPELSQKVVAQGSTALENPSP